MGSTEETNACAECHDTGVVGDEVCFCQTIVSTFEETVAERLDLNGGRYTRFVGGDIL